MRFAIFTSVAFLGSLAAATLPGYVDKCKYPTEGSSCCAPPSRLFRRDIEARTTCAPETMCCKEKTIPKFDALAPLQCGKSNVKSSKVEVSVKPCPDKPSEYCLHVYYAPFADGTKYTEYHLQLSKVPITKSAPGLFSFSDTCSFGVDNLSINCYVPVSRIASDVYGDSNFDWCSKTALWIAAHAVYGTETCWAGTIPIEDNTKNWAKSFTGNWDCETICEQECTCPCPPPSPSDKYCEKGTGYAYNPSCDGKYGNCGNQLDKLTQCNAAKWGWWFEIPSTSFTNTYDLIEGAGQNDPTKGTKVGTVTVTVDSAGSVEVTYNMNDPYAINKAQIDLKCSKDTIACAPGLYLHNSSCLGNDPTYSKDLGNPKCTTGKLYLTFHADVTVKAESTDTCKEVRCL